MPIVFSYGCPETAEYLFWGCANAKNFLQNVFFFYRENVFFVSWRKKYRKTNVNIINLIFKVAKLYKYIYCMYIYTRICGQLASASSHWMKMKPRQSHISVENVFCKSEPGGTSWLLPIPVCPNESVKPGICWKHAVRWGHWSMSRDCLSTNKFTEKDSMSVLVCG